LPVIFAGFVAPFDPAEQHRDHPFEPPSRIELTSRFVVSTKTATGRLPIHFFIDGHLFGVDRPGQLFLFGTDRYGRDVFSRVLYGGRLSLGAGITAAALAMILGVGMGALAGYRGDWVDDLIMRLSEVTLAVPWLYLLLAARAFLPLDLGPAATLLLVTSVIGAIGWVRPARLVRGVVLSVREQSFVEASRSFGASSLFVVRRHIAPQLQGLLVTQAALLVPQAVVAEVTLSFFGLGVAEPAASWGTMLAALLQPAALRLYWWLAWPAVVLFLYSFGYYGLARAASQRGESTTLDRG
jgi:peptide/nickel transport system permease protein